MSLRTTLSVSVLESAFSDTNSVLFPSLSIRFRESFVAAFSSSTTPPRLIDFVTVLSSS